MKSSAGSKSHNVTQTALNMNHGSWGFLGQTEHAPSAVDFVSVRSGGACETC